MPGARAGRTIMIVLTIILVAGMLAATMASSFIPTPT